MVRAPTHRLGPETSLTPGSVLCSVDGRGCLRVLRLWVPRAPDPCPASSDDPSLNRLYTRSWRRRTQMGESGPSGPDTDSRSGSRWVTSRRPQGVWESSGHGCRLHISRGRTGSRCTCSVPGFEAGTGSESKRVLPGLSDLPGRGVLVGFGDTCDLFGYPVSPKTPRVLSRWSSPPGVMDPVVRVMDSGLLLLV